MNLSKITLDFRNETILDLAKDFIIDNPIINQYGDVHKLPGDEHYYLLAAISMQLKNKKIIELGTHNGRSAIALNYGNIKNNNKNTIYTYDIMYHLAPNIFDNTSINFNMQNLLDQSTREINRNHILSADLIFIDVDPHEGTVEYDMYLWLKNNDYKGLILYDDILLEEGHQNVYTGNSMRKFWSKVDDQYKKELTHVGHYSGTGLVCFNFDNYDIIV